MKRWLLPFFLPFLLVLPALYALEFTLETGRSREQEVERLRELGIAAAPAFTAQLFLGREEELLPLGGLSHVQTVLCDEAGELVSYEADRHGFRNPDSLWDESSWDLAVLGDSYVQGYCEPDGSNFVDGIRRAYPRTANLGSFGNGPLANLASLVEYTAKYRPKTVVWVYVPNDLRIDLPLEMESPILNGYLEGRAQGLQDRQQELDDFLRREEEGLKKPHDFSWKRFLLMGRLNRWWSQRSLSAARTEPEEPGFAPDYMMPEALDYELFGQVLQEASRIVSSWNGRLLVLAVKDAYAFRKDKKGLVEEHYLRLASLAFSANARFQEFTLSGENTFDFYNPLDRYYGHVNRAGHEELVKQTLEALSRDPLQD